MSEFKIQKVSTNPPRSWSFNDKRTGQPVPMETYKVMLEGVDEPVDLNRKPGQVPTVGEVLNGSLEDSDFGKKFKAERRPGAPFPAKDQGLITAQWAIGQAVSEAVATKTPVDMDAVENRARMFFAMAHRVKDMPLTSAGYDKFKAAGAKLKGQSNTFSDGSPVPTQSPVDEIFPVPEGDEPINLDDIPF